MAIKVYTGTVSVDESAGAGTETLIKRIAALASGFRQRISSIWLDCTNSTVGGTARIKIDLGAAGATQRTIADYDLAFIAGESINLLKDGPFEADTDIEVYVATAGGGAARDFYYRIPYDDSIEKVQSVFNATGATDDVDLSMRSLGVANDTGDAVQFVSTNAAGKGLYCAGPVDGIHAAGTAAGAYGFYINSFGEIDAYGLGVAGVGSGHAAVFTGGATGRALDIIGGGTSGNGVNIATTDGHGINIAHNGNTAGVNIVTAGGSYGVNVSTLGTALSLVATAAGQSAFIISSPATAILATATASGAGAILTGAAAGTGNGLRLVAGGNSNALHCAGAGTGSGGYFASGAGATGNAITAVALSTAGMGAYFQGSTSGNGIRADGGATGDGVQFNAGGGNAHGLAAYGAGAGNGLAVTGGATGNGGSFTAGGGNTMGILATGSGTGHGFTMVKGGGAGSKDIDADEISSIVSSVALMPTTTVLEGAFKMIGGQHKPSYKDLTYIV